MSEIEHKEDLLVFLKDASLALVCAANSATESEGSRTNLIGSLAIQIGGIAQTIQGLEDFLRETWQMPLEDLVDCRDIL